MKKQNSLLLAAFAVAVLSLFFVGCASLDRAFYRQEKRSIPGGVIATNTVFTTNVVEIAPAQTNDVTGEVTPAQLQQTVTPHITYEYAAPTIATNLVPKAGAVATTQVVGASPLPFAGVVGFALSTLLTGYAAVRNKQLAREATSNGEAVATALIAGVQAFREYAQTVPEGKKLDAKLKEYLKSHQVAAGVMGDVADLLYEIKSEKAG